MLSIMKSSMFSSKFFKTSVSAPLPTCRLRFRVDVVQEASRSWWRQPGIYKYGWFIVFLGKQRTEKTSWRAGSSSFQPSLGTSGHRLQCHVIWGQNVQRIVSSWCLLSEEWPWFTQTLAHSLAHWEKAVPAAADAGYQTQNQGEEDHRSCRHEKQFQKTSISQVFQKCAAGEIRQVPVRGVVLHQSEGCFQLR